MTDDEPIPCPFCGEVETVELTHEDDEGHEQSITLCAGCGSDE